MSKPGDAGTCGFCGDGGGWLGDQGDESTQYLHSAVRKGEAPDWTYEKHPGAYKSEYDLYGQNIIWCGMCLGGLQHKFQRYDDHNLEAEHLALKFWLELDGVRWATGWEGNGELRKKSRKYQDDPAIHMAKLNRERRLEDIQNELFRRAGFDLTSRGWRP